MSAFTYPATVKRIVDGDTVHVDVDLGFHVTLNDVPVRVAHMNAPELATDAGKTAREYAMTLLPVGQAVTLASHSLDKYGRVLGSIEYDVGGGMAVDFGGKMIADGYAVPYEGGAR